MSIKIPAEVRAAMAEIARKFGSQGGRSARAKKAATAAAKKRTAHRLARAAGKGVAGKAAKKK
jgi:hypothetical protein